MNTVWKKEKEQVMTVLETYRNTLTNMGFHVLGLFCYGSQNYHMANPASDVDAYAVVLPSATEFTYGTPMNQTVSMENGEVKVKDIRVYARELLKGNYSTLESLVTPYRIAENTDVFKGLDALTDELIRYDRMATIRSGLGSVEEMKRTMEKHPETRWKQLGRIRHLHFFLRHMMTYRGDRTELKYALWGNASFWKEPHPELLKCRQLKETVSGDEDLWLQAFREMTAADADVRNQYETWKETNWPQWKKGQEPRRKETELALAKWVKQVFLLELFRSGLDLEKLTRCML